MAAFTGCDLYAGGQRVMCLNFFIANKKAEDSAVLRLEKGEASEEGRGRGVPDVSLIFGAY